MVECLTWKDLSESELVTILNAEDTWEIRRNVRDAFRIQDDGDEKREIVVDLYYNTLMYAKDNNTDFVCARKEVHYGENVDINFHCENHPPSIHWYETLQYVGRLPMDRSWEKTKQILLTHSVQRPPFSMAIFSMADLQAITHYLLHTYFRHYKMYQYAFMPTFILNIETLDTGYLIELPPYITELKTFGTQEEYNEEQERLQKEREDEEARLVEEARLAAEEERKRQIEAAYLAAIPDEITQKVIDVLTKHLETMKKELNEQIHVTEDKVVNKIVEIDSRIPPPPKPGSMLRSKSMVGSIRGSLAGSVRGSLKK